MLYFWRAYTCSVDAVGEVDQDGEEQNWILFEYFDISNEQKQSNLFPLGTQ